MDKNNPQKQKSSLYLLKSKANMFRFICIKTRQYLEKQHFAKENKPLPCSKPGPPHLAFNHNERSCTLVRGLLLVLLFIWNTSECIDYSTMPRPQRAKTWRRFLLCFLRRRKTEFTRDDDGPTSRQVPKPAGDQWRKCSSLVKSFITATTQSGLYNVDATRVFPCSSVSWIIECTVRHRPCLSGLHELDYFRIINNSNVVKLSKLIGLDLVLA